MALDTTDSLDNDPLDASKAAEAKANGAAQRQASASSAERAGR